MAEDGPRRLKSRRDTPPALAHALIVLQRGTDEAARMKRVAAELGPLMDLPLEAASGIMRRGALPARSSRAMRAGAIGAIALLAPLLLWWAGARPLSRVVIAPSARAVAAASASTGESSQPQLPAADDVQAPVAAPPPPVAGVQPAAAHARAALAPRRVYRKRSRSPRLAAPTQLPAFVKATRELDTPADPIVAPPASEPATQTPIAAVERRASPPAPAPAPRTRSPNESELLLHAQQSVRADPEGALRLLAEHEARFPQGALVPEREALAIEALRRLGRSQLAAARLERFRARYPRSFYLDWLAR